MQLEERLKLLRSDGIIPRAVIYARFSSDNQREESVDAQLRAAREFAKSHDIKIVREYVDKAKTATSDDRENFQQMIKDSASGTFHIVLVHKLDRFARNKHDSVFYKYKLKRNSVTLVSVLENFDDESPEGALLEGVIESVNEFYSLNLSREVKKGLKENALKCLYNGGTPPFGYDIDPATKKYIINPNEAAAVKLIFSMTQKRYSYAEIIEALADKGYRTKSGNFFKRNSIHDILRNPKYTGLYTYMRRTPKNKLTHTRNSHKYNSDSNIIKVPNGLPAIIDQSLFDEVQAILDSRKGKRLTKKEFPTLLSSKIVCGECGAPYCIDRVKRKNGINYYISYRCNNRKNKTGIICKNLSIAQEYIDNKVVELLSDILFNPAIIPRLLERYNKALEESNSQNHTELEEVKQQIKGKNKAIANILKSLERVDSEELTQHLINLENSKKQLIENLHKLESENKVEPMNVHKLEGLLKQAKELFLSGNNQDTKRLIDIFIDKVVVYSDYVDVIANPAPFLQHANYTKISQEIPRK